MFFTKAVILRIVCSLCLFVNTDLWFNPQNWKEFTASFHCVLDDLQTGKFSAFLLSTEMQYYIHSYWENKRNFKEKSWLNYLHWDISDFELQWVVEQQRYILYIFFYNDSKGPFALEDNYTNFLCRQHNFWNGLYGYQCYCSHLTTRKNDQKDIVVVKCERAQNVMETSNCHSLLYDWSLHLHELWMACVIFTKSLENFW